MDLVQTFSQGIDFAIVGMTIAVTQLLKYLLPTPAGGDLGDVHPTLNRLLPVVPLVLGIVFVIIFKPGLVWREYAKQGLIYGMLGAYFYRTAKVSFFGD